MEVILHGPGDMEVWKTCVFLSREPLEDRWIGMCLLFLGLQVDLRNSRTELCRRAICNGYYRIRCQFWADLQSLLCKNRWGSTTSPWQGMVTGREPGRGFKGLGYSDDDDPGLFILWKSTKLHIYVHFLNIYYTSMKFKKYWCLGLIV